MWSDSIFPHILVMAMTKMMEELAIVDSFSHPSAPLAPVAGVVGL
jgi:hypothetical protein